MVAPATDSGRANWCRFRRQNGPAPSLSAYRRVITPDLLTVKPRRGPAVVTHVTPFFADEHVTVSSVRDLPYASAPQSGEHSGPISPRHPPDQKVFLYVEPDFTDVIPTSVAAQSSSQSAGFEGSFFHDSTFTRHVAREP